MSRHTNIGLDFAKVISCIAVVFLHTIRRTNADVDELWVLYYLCRFAVPLFLSVSGFLLLGRQTDFSYRAKKIGRMLLYIVGWTVLYALLLAVCNGKFSIYWSDVDFFGHSVPVPTYMLNGLLANSVAFGIFWYIGAMILIYIMLPVIRRLFEKNAVALLAVLFAVCLAFHLANLYTAFTDGTFFNARIPRTFRIWTWLMYFVIGGFIGKNIGFISKIRTSVCVALLGVCTVLSVLFQYWLFMVRTDEVNSEYVYESPLIILWVSLILITCERIKYSKIMRNVIVFVANNFVGIYALHSPFILHTVMRIPKGIPALYIVYGVAVFVICLGVSEVIRRIPVVNRILYF